MTRACARVSTFDQCFGTAINRFCCQAVIGHPLTLFGLGEQKRGFLPLADSMQCLGLAVENPAAAGEYRVFNQFENAYSISELARLVQEVAAEIGLPKWRSSVTTIPAPSRKNTTTIRIGSICWTSDMNQRAISSRSSKRC